MQRDWLIWWVMLGFCGCGILGGHLAMAAPQDDLMDLFAEGRHRVVDVQSGAPLEQIRELIEELHPGTEGNEFEFVRDAGAILEDEQTAGLLAAGVADLAVRQALRELDGQMSVGAEEHAQRVRIADAALKELRDDGGWFGFDGYWQNGCAAPTAFLLVGKTGGSQLTGIDLRPCRE